MTLENLIVKDVVIGLENRDNKDITREKLAEKYGVTTRTITNRLKSVGFKWSKNKYEYIGEADLEEIYAIKFDSLFEDNTPIQKQLNNSKSNSNSDSEKIAEKKQINSESKAIKKQSNVDDIDRLLLGGENIGRVYKGFYIDDDLAEIVDRVNKGSKSDLINMCLRKVFEEKGLL